MHAELERVPEEDAILVAIREGRHREALSLCAREHGAAMGRFAMALLGHQADADEAVQEALLAAHDALPSYRGESSVRAYLYGILRHVAAKRIATHVRRERRLVLVRDVESDASSSPEDELRAWRRARRLRLALEELRPSEREAVLLRYEAGLSFREVGDALSIDEASARKRVSRALLRLRDSIGEVG